MRIDHSSASDLLNQISSQTGQKQAATEQAERARASYRYNQNAGSAEILDAEYVDTPTHQTKAAISSAKLHSNRLAAELYFLNNEAAVQPQGKSGPGNSQTQRYQKTAAPQVPSRGTYLDIVA